MAIYSKFCIMCNREFRTMRISTLFCCKRCANRSRSLPSQLKESLIRRGSSFTMIEDNRPQYRVNEDNGLLMAHALEIAKQRGIKVNKVVEDNLQFINTTDPANGDSTGFGIRGDNTNKQEIEQLQATEKEQEKHNEQPQQIQQIQNKGIRRIGIRK